jgi:hypothetical protein
LKAKATTTFRGQYYKTFFAIVLNAAEL